jgi:hypothetical protein
LLQPQNKDLLVKILTYHVVPGKVQSSDLKAGDVETVEGSPVAVKIGNSGVMINNAKVLQADIQATNGVIHVIDHVMLPRDLQGSSSQPQNNKLNRRASNFEAQIPIRATSDWGFTDQTSNPRRYSRRCRPTCRIKSNTSA